MTDFRKFKFVSPGMRIDEIDNTLRETLPRETGPVFIGRAKRGPIFKPIFVTSQKELIDIFGAPEYGGGGNGDVWHNGDCLSPMYGLYAAFSYLKNHNAATFVRLAGDEHPLRTSGSGEAGWITTLTSPTSGGVPKDGGAYALFVTGVKIPETNPRTSLVVSPSSTNSGEGSVSATGSLNANCALGILAKITITSSGEVGVAKYKLGIYDGATYQEGSELTTSTSPVEIFINGVGSGISYSFSAGVGGGDDFAVGDFFTIEQRFQNVEYKACHAATFYVDEGALALEGRDLYGFSSVGTAGFIRSSGPDFEFVLRTYADSSDKTKYKNKLSFNFNKRSSRYIRRVCNTNPTLVNDEITKLENLSPYWLGETYTSYLYKNITPNATFYVGTLLKIEKEKVSAANHLVPFRAAESGWIFSQNLDADGPGVYGGQVGKYDPNKMIKLFRFHSIDGGSWFHANVKVSIDRIRYSKTRGNPYGSFDVVVRSAADSDRSPAILETFANCNLDVNSSNFILKKIGNVHYEWDPDSKRYIKYGTYENNSKYIYVEVAQEVADGSIEPSLLPWGYFGPPAFDSVVISNYTAGGDILFPEVSGTGVVGSWIHGHGKIAFSLGTGSSNFQPIPSSGNIVFDSPALRLRETFSEEGTSRSQEVFWGARTMCWDVDKYDSDLQDYLRNDSLPLRGKEGTETGYKHSYIFTLDDVCYEEVNSVPSYSITNRGVYIKDSYKYGRSITAGYLRKTDGNLDTTITADYKLLCDKDMARFTVVFWGGFDGMDIVEKDPFRNTLIESYSTPDDATESYALYSLLKAIDVVSDKDVVSYDMISMPGITNNIINKQLTEMAKSRKDCLAIIDLPGQYLPSHENNQDEKYRFGSVKETVKLKQDTEIAEGNSYAATYFNWIRALDPFNRSVSVWLPPSVAAAGVIAYTRNRGDVWDAPAGYTNGNLSAGNIGLTVVDTMFIVSNEDRDLLYENSINPIGRFPEGILVMGQKTLQGIPSYLDRINVRLLVNHIKRFVEFKGKKSLFEPNIYVTWQRFINEIDPFLRDIQTKGGLNRYEIVFDDTTTTMEMIDRNEMYAKIYIQPTTVAEYFGVDLVIAKNGVSFVD